MGGESIVNVRTFIPNIVNNLNERSELCIGHRIDRFFLRTPRRPGRA